MLDNRALLNLSCDSVNRALWLKYSAPFIPRLRES